MVRAPLEPQLSHWERFFGWLRNAFRSRYVVHLERENEELRAQLQGIQNSLLAGLGLPEVRNESREGVVFRPNPKLPPSVVRARFEDQARKHQAEKEKKNAS